MRFDVAILGAGPAGCAAALALLREGCSVAIVEGTPFPRHRPGETLSPGIEPVLASLGAESAVLEGTPLRFAATCVTWGGRAAVVPYGADEQGPWCGFQVSREDLDSRLLRHAVSQGAVLIEGRPLDLLVARERVAGLKTMQGDLHADWTLDATGRARWLMRRLGVEVSIRSPRLHARYGYAAVDADYPVLPHLRADSTGWTWTAKVGNHRALWLRVTEASLTSQRRWTPPHLIGKHEPAVRAADVTWSTASHLFGAGWLLCGDAAGQLDPSSGHGVLRAAMSGVMAARAVSRGALGSYADWFRDSYEHDAGQMAANYREARLFGHAA
ncbi:tryptophan 7-halogenase [Mitsuaria sp. CC2]|uniref:NAD(P)/FAD-dependent oxidoreductase n=1 Tax=Mitsuaria sp. CC2 TaxID=3029186 RepID=UPI003B8B833D